MRECITKGGRNGWREGEREEGYFKGREGEREREGGYYKGREAGREGGEGREGRGRDREKEVITKGGRGGREGITRVV